MELASILTALYAFLYNCSPSLRYSLSVVLFFLTLCFWYLFIYSTISSSLSSSRFEIEQLTQKKAILEKRAIDVTGNAEELEKLTQQIELQSQSLPRSVQSQREKLKKLMIAHGLTIKSTKPEKKEKYPQFVALPVSYLLIGNYSELVSLFTDLSKEMPTVHCARCAIKKSRGEMRVELSLFILAQEAA